MQQVNLPAQQARLNYDQLTSIYKLLSKRFNSLVPPLVVSQEVNTKSLEMAILLYINKRYLVFIVKLKN